MRLFKHILFFSLAALFCVQNASAGWTKVNSGTLSWLHSISFIDQNRGFIVGSRGTFLRTIDGGKTWKADAKFTSDNLLDVHFADEKHGWILSERDIYALGTYSPSHILETFDGGTTWTDVKFEGEGRERLTRMFFSSDGTGRAVGESGTVFSMTSDRGLWKKGSVPVPYLMLDGSFTDASHGLVVGGNGSALFTEDGGVTWNTSSFAAKPSVKLNSVFFINRTNGWAVGAQGKIYFTNNGGKFWRDQNSPVKADLFDVFFLNTAEGWAIGDHGTMLSTTTGGNVWNPVQSADGHKLERVFFVGNCGWAVGFGGTIMLYDTRAVERVNPVPAPVLQKRNNSAASASF